MAYKLLALVAGLFGQVSSYIATGGGIGQFFYYTNQSNILCIVYLALAAVFVARKIKAEGARGEATFAPRFKGAVVMGITVTMLIYWLLLSGSGFGMAGAEGGGGAWFVATPLYTVSNYFVHLIVPLLVITDWLVFDPKGRFKAVDPLLWEVIPLCYWGFAAILAQTGRHFADGRDRYPYFFIDPDRIGYPTVFLFVGALVLAFLVLGYVMLGLDRLLAKLAGRKE